MVAEGEEKYKRELQALTENVAYLNFNWTIDSHNISATHSCITVPFQPSGFL